jgi:hypothetical protein
MTDISQCAESIGFLLGNIFGDHQPTNEEGVRAVYELMAGIHRHETGVGELDDAIQDAYLAFSDRPHAEWKIEIDFDLIVSMAAAVVRSAGRPDTQLVGPSSLEMLVDDQTRHSILLPPQGTSIVHNLTSLPGDFAITVGPPSIELLIRCSLLGFSEQSAVFDSERLFRFLTDEEARRGLADGSTTRISAIRLLTIMIRPELLSLHVAAADRLEIDVLEQIATAFRVRMAYETSIVYAPILEVDGIKDKMPQPSFVRQLYARSTEFVEAIGERRPTGVMGDQLLGNPSITNEELSLRYLRAVAARDPFSVFMGYYHVLEYGMNEAWYNALSTRVAAAGHVLQGPQADTRDIVVTAAALLNVRPNEIRYSELRALKALANSRFDIDGFAADLGRYIYGALEYFANGNLPFADVANLDFSAVQDAASRTKLIDKLAERIYTVRCAITHSKASGKRYSPYTDDLYLGREVPLVRIAAEQILIPVDARL